MESDEEEDFVFYGTPLEPLEDDEIAPKKPRNDQTVRDEKGRRRFHGAFTGGFSAGYFNTVSTKEGWAPSTFISSRSKKAGQVEQRPEDFMDDEDFSEHGIAPRRVQMTSKFSDVQKETAQKRSYVEDEGPIPGEAPLKDLIRPVNESIGVRLLQKMGWRSGQGIGPRMKKKEKDAEKKVYGCMLPPTAFEDEDDPYALAFTFAPEDVSVLQYTPKDNLHGIGYKGLDRTSVLSNIVSSDATMTKGTLEKGKKKISIRGQAFGVGAFEEEDEDIYSKEDMSMYDFTLEEDPSNKPEVKEKPVKNRNSVNVHNVTKALEGFHLAREKPPAKKVFPPPQIPPDFKPIHKTKSSSVTESDANLKVNKFLNRHALSAEERGAKLGDNFRSVPPPTSVFNLVSAKDKERIEEAKKKPADAPLAYSVETILNPDAIQIGSFKPFARNEEKQKRYEKYLSLLKAGKKDALEMLQPSTMTEWEKQREKAEFQRAAVLYRPLSSALNTRFVSSTSMLEDDDKIEVKISDEGDKTEQMKAAKMKMFGKLTREIFPWHPASLLCKRFNVPNPYPDSTLVGLPKVKRDKFSLFNFLTPTLSEQSSQQEHSNKTETHVILEDQVMPSTSSKTADTEVKISSEMRKDVTGTNSQLQVKESQRKAKERPPMDLFKAIFASSSEESDSESEKEEAVSITKPPEPIRTETESAKITNNFGPVISPRSKNVTVAKSGVFANLDLDAINARPPVVENTLSLQILPMDASKQTKEERIGLSEIDNAKDPGSKDDQQPEFYGPRLPPSFTDNEGSSQLYSSDTPHRKSKHAKERKHSKHKHKHKNKDSKKKKRKHRKEIQAKKHPSESGTDSNSSSDTSNITSQEILERLKQLQRKTI